MLTSRPDDSALGCTLNCGEKAHTNFSPVSVHQFVPLYLCVSVNGLHIVDESGEECLAHGASGGHLGPLYYALETETVYTEVKESN